MSDAAAGPAAPTLAASAAANESAGARSSRPILALLALATVLPEMFSGSTPLPSFVTNPGLLLFLFLGYGVAVLLVRELAVRAGVGLAGLFVMGLGYSIFNEGLLAKTLIREVHLPVPLYDHYGCWGGISFPWAAGIGAWHAGASVLFPILLTHQFFPERSRTPWLRGRMAFELGVFLMLFGSVVFLGRSEQGAAGTPVQLGIFLVLMLSLFGIGAALKGTVRREPTTSRVRPVLLGLSVLIPFWGLGILASAELPVAVFFMALFGVILFYAWLLGRQRWSSTPALLFFGVGWYLHNALQATLIIGGAQKRPLLALVTAVVDALILGWLVRVNKNCSRDF